MAKLAKDQKAIEQSNESGTREELLALLTEFDTGMLVTKDEHGFPRARPMALRMREHDHALWFITSDEAPKTLEIERDPHVGAIFYRGRDRAWVSVSGRAALIRDRQRTKELWTPAMKMYFEGPDDPSILLVRIEPNHAEFYEPTKPKVVRVFEMIKGMVTNAPPDLGAVKHVGPAELHRQGARHAESAAENARPTHPSGK